MMQRIFGRSRPPLFRTVFQNPWTPQQLFSDTTLGYWFDMSLSRLWQDAARTTPVAAPGDPIGSIALSTALGTIYATQSTAAARPLYELDPFGRPCMRQNGSSQFLAVPNLSIIGTEPLLGCFGAERETTTSNTALMSLGGSGINTTYPGMQLQIRGSSAPAYSPQTQSARAATNASMTSSSNSFGDTGKRVVSFTRSEIRVNRAKVSTSGAFTDFTGYNTANNRLGCGYTFANTSFWKGRIYNGVFCTINPNTEQLDLVERWANETTVAF